MFLDIMAAIVAGGVVVIGLLLLIVVFLGVQISNKLEDLLDHLRGGLGKTVNETLEEEEKNGQ